MSDLKKFGGEQKGSISAKEALVTLVLGTVLQRTVIFPVQESYVSLQLQLSVTKGHLRFETEQGVVTKLIHKKQLKVNDNENGSETRVHAGLSALLWGP